MKLRPDQTANQLLSYLSRADFALIEPFLVHVELPLRRQLEVKNRRIEYAYFPESGLASVLAAGGAGHNVEVGVIGKEGVSGLPTILEADRAVHETFMQIAGLGWRIAADDLHAVMAQSATLRSVFLRYVQTMMVQMSSSALANTCFPIDERLARWLLMAQDRIDAPVITLTHEFLALMLGSRRAGVTNAIAVLRGKNIIEANRGTITRLNRGALTDAANGSYGAPEHEYDRMFPRSAVAQTGTG